MMDNLLQMICLNNLALEKLYSYLLNKNHVSSVLQMSLQAIRKKSEQKAISIGENIPVHIIPQEVLTWCLHKAATGGMNSGEHKNHEQAQVNLFIETGMSTRPSDTQAFRKFNATVNPKLACHALLQ